MNTKCEFCKKTFSNTYILKNHKMKAKYCLEIQNKKKVVFVIEEDFQCDLCDKTLSSKQSLNNHLAICRTKNIDIIVQQNTALKIQLKNLQEQLANKDINFKEQLDSKNIELDKKDLHIKELEDRLERVANKAIEKPTTISTSTYNNNSTNHINLATFNITPESTKQILKDKLKREHLYYGMGGFADFAKEHLLTLENGEIIYKCFDVSRQIFKYVDDNGTLIKDVKAKKLMGLIREPVVLRILEIINDYNKEYEELNKEIYDMNTDTRELRKKIEKIDYYRKEALKLKTDINLMEENNKFAIELSTRISD
jgi:hypothetical protein